MKKYLVFVGQTSEKYEFPDLESAVKCFAEFVEKNVKASIMMQETRILGSYLPYEKLCV